MSDLLTAIVPLLAFMLIPLWIPLIASVTGAVLGRLRPRQAHPVVAQRVRTRAATAAA